MSEPAYSQSFASASFRSPRIFPAPGSPIQYWVGFFGIKVDGAFQFPYLPGGGSDLLLLQSWSQISAKLDLMCPSLLAERFAAASSWLRPPRQWPLLPAPESVCASFLQGLTSYSILCCRLLQRSNRQKCFSTDNCFLVDDLQKLAPRNTLNAGWMEFHLGTDRVPRPMDFLHSVRAAKVTPDASTLAATPPIVPKFTPVPHEIVSPGGMLLPWASMIAFDCFV